MNNTPLVYLGVGLLAFAFILYRQLRTRRLTFNLRLPLIIGVIGVVEVGDYLTKNPVSPPEVISLVIGLVAAAAIAWPRAMSMKVWCGRDGRLWCRGTALTVLLWLLVIAVHVGISLGVPRLFGEASQGFGGFESASLMIYLAISIGAQSWFRQRHPEVRRHGAAVLDLR